MSNRACPCATCVACTCGRHVCEYAKRNPKAQRAPLHYDPADCQSVTQRDYRPPTRDQLASRAPAPEWSKSSLPPPRKFEGESTTRAAYKAPPPSATPFFDRGAAAPPPRQQLPFDADTAYHSDFSPKVPDRAAGPPSDRHLQSHVTIGSDDDRRFNGVSTSRDEFRPKTIQHAPGPVREIKPRPSLPFEGESVTRSEFTDKSRSIENVGHRAPQQQPFVPTQTKFEGTTTSRDTFRPLDREAYAPAHSPPPPPKPRASLPFEGESVTHSQYRPHPGARPSEPNGPSAFASHFPPSVAGIVGGDPNSGGDWSTEARAQFDKKVCPAAAWAKTYSQVSSLSSTPNAGTPRNY